MSKISLSYSTVTHPFTHPAPAISQLSFKGTKTLAPIYVEQRTDPHKTQITGRLYKTKLPRQAASRKNHTYNHYTTRSCTHIDKKKRIGSRRPAPKTRKTICLHVRRISGRAKRELFRVRHHRTPGVAEFSADTEGAFLKSPRAATRRV